ncbi:MAG: dockerin type I repeat-containing protein [Clostridia bacterium]|nr:dockerin type I repeat-containing protein [Clostridia bacterium]
MKKLTVTVTTLLFALLFLTGLTIFATDGNTKYESIITNHIQLSEDYCYEELFEYHVTEQLNSDYVLIKAHESVVPDILVSSDFGGYRIITGSYSPYEHGYYIYIPASDKLYTLEEAYDADITDIEEAFRYLNGTAVVLMGDADGNFELNIKDATMIQKHVANLVNLNEFHKESYIGYDACDFTDDCQLNIKDATAIQKHIAGIPV